MTRSWVPPYSEWPSADDYPAFEQTFPSSEIARIAGEHRIPLDKCHAFELALRTAHRIFVSEQMLSAQSDDRIADKQTAKELHSSLVGVIRGLRSPEMWPRMMAPNAEVFPAKTLNVFDSDSTGSSWLNGPRSWR
jgi:hypothetical protein